MNRLVFRAILGGIVCASAVVFVCGIGLQIHNARYALVPFFVGLLVLLVLRLTVPKTE